MIEIFKNIDGYDNYQITNFGRVFDVRREMFLEPYRANINGKVYMQLSLLDNDGKRCLKRIHRLVSEAFIENPENKTSVDHIDGDGTNNNVHNLRFVTHQQNMMNRKPHENKFKGIEKDRQKFRARIFYDGKYYELGRHATAEEAALCYNIAAKVLFKDYACFNIVGKTENYKQLKYLTFFKLSKHFDNIDDLVEKYRKYA